MGEAPAFSVVPDAPRSDDPVLVSCLRADLGAAGFTVDRVTDLVGPEAMAAWSRDQAVPARRALQRHGGQDPTLSTLAAFFLLGDPVRASALDAALPTVGSQGLRALGLVEAVTVDPAPVPEDAASSPEPREPAGTRWPESVQGPDRAPARAGHQRAERQQDLQNPLLSAAMGLRPYATDSSEELWVASDLGAFQRPGVLRRDHVLGIGGASTTLVQSTPRRPVATALDLGTGCGIQTFHLLAHAEHVTATDISERALATTRFNLVLNAPALGLDPQHLDVRVSLELGSMLEPVVGQHFNMVVSNPPFVITPRSTTERAEERFTYRDGGLPGDRIVRDLLGAIPSVLNPGGTAHLLANWEIPRDPEDEPSITWSRGPDSWIPRDTGVWLIQRELQDPCEYAETWLQDASQQRDPEGFDRAYAAYLDDFASRDVAAIGFGMVWLHRSEAGHENGGSGQEAPAAASPGATGAPAGVDPAAPRIFETVPHPIQQPIAPTLAGEWERILRMARETTHPGAGTVPPGEEPAWLDRYYVVAPDVTEERHGAPGAEDPSLILLRQGAGLRRTVILSSEAAGFVGVCDGELGARQILAALGALLGWESGPARQLLGEIEGLISHGFLLPVQDWDQERDR